MVASAWIWAGVIVAAISRADGIEPTRFAIRCTTPPSSSVITSGSMPFGADASRARSAVPRFAGAADPKRITPPAPAATSAVIDATSVSLTGMTRVCSASCVTLQVASTLAFEHAGGVGVGVAVATAVADAVGD